MGRTTEHDHLGCPGATGKLPKASSNEHMRELGATIVRGHAVLFALVGDVDWPKLRDGLAPYGGDLVSSEVADDVLPLLGATPPAG